MVCIHKRFPISFHKKGRRKRDCYYIALWDNRSIGQL